MNIQYIHTPQSSPGRSVSDPGGDPEPHAGPLQQLLDYQEQNGEEQIRKIRKI